MPCHTEGYAAFLVPLNLSPGSGSDPQLSRITQREIAQSLGIGRSTVGEYLARAREAGLKWPLVPEWRSEEHTSELQS